MANKQLSEIVAQPGLKQALAGLTAFYIANTTTGGWTDLDAIEAYFASNGTLVPTSEKGSPNGVATLDGSGLLPASQLPISAMEYKGTWNASTNTPTLTDGVGTNGDTYKVSVGGTIDLGSGSQTFAAGDWVLYNGSIWEKSINSDAVSSVNGEVGVVTLDTDDVAEGVTNKYHYNHASEHTDGTDDIQDASQAQKGLLNTLTQGIAGRKDFNTPPRFESLNTGNNIITTDTDGDTQESGATIEAAPSGGSGFTFVEYASAPVNPPAGFVWLQAKDANTKTLNYFNGVNTYSVDLSI